MTTHKLDKIHTVRRNHYSIIDIILGLNDNPFCVFPAQRAYCDEEGAPETTIWFYSIGACARKCPFTTKVVVCKFLAFSVNFHPPILDILNGIIHSMQ